MQLSEIGHALLVFTIYFFCEWLPMFAVYMFHLQDFHSEYEYNKRHKATEKNDVAEETADESLLVTSPI